MSIVTQGWGSSGISTLGWGGLRWLGQLYLRSHQEIVSTSDHVETLLAQILRLVSLITRQTLLHSSVELQETLSGLVALAITLQAQVEETKQRGSGVQAEQQLKGTSAETLNLNAPVVLSVSEESIVPEPLTLPSAPTLTLSLVSTIREP